MRLLAPVLGLVVLIVSAGAALPTELSTGIELGSPVIVLERVETLPLLRTATVALPEGESILALPFAELGVDPAAATLEVEPDDAARVADMEIPPGANVVRWRLVAQHAVQATLTVTCRVKGLTWSVDYLATLPPGGGMELQQNLTITNGLGRDFDEVSFVGPVSASMPLRNGETVTRQINRVPIFPEQIERSLIYDNSKYGDAPVEIMTISPEAFRPRTGPGGIPIIGKLFAKPMRLEAGSVRIYAGGEPGGELISTASMPYVPPGEAVELKLGPAPGILVERTRALAKEVNVRRDAHNKTAVYDLEETWELHVRNLRQTPIELTILEHPEGTWQVQRASATHVKLDATTLAFRLSLEPGGEQDLSYILRLINLQP